MSDSKNKHNRILKRRIALIVFDLLIVFCSFLFFVWLKPNSLSVYLPNYTEPFLMFVVVWLAISLLISKYDFHKSRKPKEALIPIIIANLTILAVVTISIYVLGNTGFSRLIVFGTFFLSTFTELFLAYLYFGYLRPVIIPDLDEAIIREPKIYTIDKSFKTENREETKYIESRDQIKKIIISKSGEKVYHFISKYIDVGNPQNLLVSTTTLFNIDKLPENNFHSITNLHKINDFIRINKFFESVNLKLPIGGVYIDNVETYQLRKKRILNKYPPVLNYIYYFFDFIFTRVFPKLPGIKKFYFYVTLGRNRVLSEAETLGRLYSCGFKCIETTFINDRFYFIAQKARTPYYDPSPSYGPLFKMNRIGLDGKIIGVYKFRTMFPYAEYLQEYIIQKYGLTDEGKPENDIRLNDWGKFLRKYWLDELPQIINIIKGDMKIVGVRPLSKYYFSLYSDGLKERRLKYKPGLVPPFYVDLPKSFESIMESELKYLNVYDKHPTITDIRYFYKAMFNIVFRKARSK